jgi:hypothetical protein
MNNRDGSSNLNLNSSKSAVRPSAEAVEHKGDTKLDQEAMGAAKRAQNRIHNNEETIPGSTIFSK